jgi:hypothetical protein
MKWKFWKRDKAPKLVAEITQDKVPLSTLIRWYCYDLGIDDVNDLVKSFNLMPVSKEGEEFEQEASERRIDAVVPLMPFIEMIAAINSKAISTIQLQEFKNEEVLEADLDPDMMEGLYRQVSFAAMVAAFSAAFELGLVNENHGLMFMEGKDE